MYDMDVQVSNNNFNGSVVSWFEHMEQSLLAGSSTFAEGTLVSRLYIFITPCQQACSGVDDVFRGVDL